MEHFAIEQTRIAHDALGDAYNTALVCTHLNMEKGLADYHDAAQKLTTRLPKEHHGENNGPDPIEHVASESYATKSELFGDAAFVTPCCPLCSGEVRYSKWVNQGDQRYMALGECPTDGKLLVRLKFRKAADCTWSATRLTYQATDSMESYYKAKAAQPRKRGRGKSRRRPAKTAQSAPQ